MDNRFGDWPNGHTFIIADAAEWERFQNKEQEISIKISELEQLLIQQKQKAGDQYQEVLALNEQLAELKRKLQQEKKKEATPPVLAPFNETSTRQLIAEHEAGLKEVKEQIKNLELQISKRKEPPEAAEVQILPGGSGVDLKPTFIECDDRSLVIYQGNEPHRVLRGNIKTDEQFDKLLAEVATAENRTVIFLVRENGISIYNLAREEALNAGARNGKLPVIGFGKLNLEHFRKQLQAG